VALHVYADEDTIHKIGSDSTVDYVETDSVASILTTVVQQGAPDGLSRISHRNIEGGSSLTYQYDDSGGQGITAYVIDTGINISHPDFGGRARYGRNLYYNNVSSSTPARQRSTVRIR
jgi:cerevisin